MRHECVHLPKIDVLTGEPSPHDLFVETQHFPAGQPQSLTGAGYRVSRRIPKTSQKLRIGRERHADGFEKLFDARKLSRFALKHRAKDRSNGGLPGLTFLLRPHGLLRSASSFHATLPPRISSPLDSRRFHFNGRYGDSKDKSYKKQSLVVSAQRPWFRAVFPSKLSWGAHMASK
jgi:hypothetical protein